MSKQITAVRSYEAKITSDAPGLDRLRRYVEKCVEVQRFAFDLVLAIQGSAEPEWMAESPRSRYSPGTKASRTERPKRNRDGTVAVVEQPDDYDTALHCFGCWFTLEKTDREGLTGKQVRKRFAAYWKETGLPAGNLVEMVLASLGESSQHEDARWVDRRAMSKKFFPKHITDDDKRRAFTDAEWPIQEKSKQSPGRSILSREVGVAKKSDFDREMRFNLAYRSAIDFAIVDGLSPRETIERFMKKAGFPAENSFSPDAADAWLRKFKNGRKDLKSKFIEKYWGVDHLDHFDKVLKSQAKRIDDRIGTTESRIKGKDAGPNPIWRWYADKFSAITGCPFNPTFAAHFLDLPMRRIRSNTKWFYNKVDSRYRSQLRVEEMSSKKLTHAWVGELVDARKASLGQHYLRKEQLNGSREVEAQWTKLPSDLPKATAIAQEMAKRFGDAGLFLEVAAEMPIYFGSDISADSIGSVIADLKLIAARDEAEADFRNERWAPIVPPSMKSFDPPQFGSQKPAFNIERLSPESSRKYDNNRRRPEGKNPHFHVTLSILEPGGVGEITIPCFGKQFALEQLATFPGRPTDLQNNAISRRKHGGNVQAETPKSLCVSIPGESEDGWYIKLSSTYSITEADGGVPAVGSKILAIDLRAGNAGSAMVVRRVAKRGHASVEGDKVRVDVNVEWSGDIGKTLLVDGVEVDAINGYSSPDIPGSIAALWEGEGTPDFATVGMDIAQTLKRWVKSARDEKRPIDFDHVRRHIDAASGKYLADGKERTVSGQGGLSRLRIEKHNVLIRALKSAIDATEGDVPDWAVPTLDRLRDKVMNLKRERARLTGAAIKDLVHKHGVSAVIVENHEFANRSAETKKTNRSLSDWCVRRIVDSIEGDCRLNSVSFRKVDPSNTSRLDFHHQVYRCCYSPAKDVTVDRAKADLTHLQAIAAKDRTKPEATRLAAWEQILIGNGYPAEPKSIRRLCKENPGLRIPDVRGRWFPNELLAEILGHEEYVPATANAAFNVAMKGLRTYCGKSAATDGFLMAKGRRKAK